MRMSLTRWSVLLARLSANVGNKKDDERQALSLDTQIGSTLWYSFDRTIRASNVTGKTQTNVRFLVRFVTPNWIAARDTVRCSRVPIRPPNVVFIAVSCNGNVSKLTVNLVRTAARTVNEELISGPLTGGRISREFNNDREDKVALLTNDHRVKILVDSYLTKVQRAE